MKTRSLLMGILVISIILLIACIDMSDKAYQTTTTTTTIPKVTARYGDTVSVNYIGRLENGTIFDTSYEDVAREAGIYSPIRKYGPLIFKIGGGRVLPGFEREIIGMHVGEEKTFRVPPELGYGNWNPKKVIEINRVQKSPRVINISWDLFKTNINEEPVVNKTYVVPTSRWNITVLSIINGTIEIRQDPRPGSVIQTIYGPGVINVTDTEILVRLNPKLGDKVQTRRGVATVAYIGDRIIRLDYNHDLAGKTLYFDVRVENITKTDTS